MQNVQVLVFVGMPGSGKSICVDYVTAKGVPSVYFGGITIDEVKKRGLEVNEANEKIVREGIREEEGQDAYAKRIIAQIEELAKQGHPKVVVDGLYTWDEYKIFADYFGDKAVFVAITAPRRERHERLAKRPVRPLNKEESSSRDYAEIENMRKGGPIANADYTIVNDGSVEQLQASVEKILKEISF